MTRRPGKRTAEPAPTNSLLDALKFLSVITKEVGSPNETHVYMCNGWVAASNGVLSAATKIEQDLIAAPNNKLFIEALSKCKTQFSLTQLDSGKLSIKSDKFKAVIPCIDPILININGPDQPCAVIDDRLKQAVETVGILADSNGQKVHLASVLMNGLSCIATNGVMMFEAWHGIDLPPNVAFPKLLSDALKNTNKKPIKFGFSLSSITIYFDDESWIKAQLFAEQWPKIAHILDASVNAFDFPKEFFNGLDAIAPFSEDGLAHTETNLLMSHHDKNAGATFEVEGLPSGLTFNIKQMNMVRGIANKVDFFAKGHNNFPLIYFYGENFRGAIAGRNK